MNAASKKSLKGTVCIQDSKFHKSHNLFVTAMNAKYTDRGEENIRKVCAGGSSRVELRGTNIRNTCGFSEVNHLEMWNIPKVNVAKSQVVFEGRNGECIWCASVAVGSLCARIFYSVALRPANDWLTQSAYHGNTVVPWKIPLSCRWKRRPFMSRTTIGHGHLKSSTTQAIHAHNNIIICEILPAFTL